MEQNTIESQEDVIPLGKKLANRRIALGLTENDLAEQIHVRTTIIKDIENGNKVNIPPVFVRGYIKNYAEFVGLPLDEYLPYLNSYTAPQSAQVMKNYSHKEKVKRNGKKNVLITLGAIFIIVSVIVFFAWKQDKKELVEVSHYISSQHSANLS